MLAYDLIGSSLVALGALSIATMRVRANWGLARWIGRSVLRKRLQNAPQVETAMAGIINTATRLSSSWEEAWARV